MTELPEALRQARDKTAAKIVTVMPGCSLPDCLACKNNRKEASALASEAIVTALRWVLFDSPDYDNPDAAIRAAIAALEANQ
jgi:hypothetical protein